jgi:hypothetical protein
LFAVYKGDEPWGKYDLRPYKYMVGEKDSLVPPLINLNLQVGIATNDDPYDIVNSSFYSYVRKLQNGFGNCIPGEPGWGYDFKSQMAACGPRNQPQAKDYPGNSVALREKSFSDLKGVENAVGFSYIGNGATSLSMAEVTQAYGNGGVNTIGNFTIQGGAGNMPVDPPAPNTDNGMSIMWDYIHMSHFAREDFADYLASKGNMGVCGEEIKYKFFKYDDPDDVIYKVKKNKSYTFYVKYQLMPGTTGQNIVLNSKVIPY